MEINKWPECYRHGIANCHICPEGLPEREQALLTDEEIRKIRGKTDYASTNELLRAVAKAQWIR